jgi:hypothetical protein
MATLLGFRWVAAEVFMDEPHLAVISVERAIGVVAQGQQIREPVHGIIRVGVIHRVHILAPGGADGCEVGRRPWPPFTRFAWSDIRITRRGRRAMG